MRRTQASDDRRFRRTHAALILSLAAFAFVTACSSKKGDGHRYDLKGKVVAVDRSKQEVTVDHEEIKGYMPAMTMEYPLRDEDALKIVEAGDGLQATLVVADDNTYWLEDPIITKALPGANNSSATAGGTEPQTGAEVPDVKLVNQDGRQISIGQFRGRALLVTFVYTRCPQPDQCPLMSANFAQVNAALQSDPDLKKKAHLLSVTLDPEYDKPEVLHAYGAAYAGGKFDDWDFATGEPADVRRFAEFFGLMYKRDNGQLIHSLRTAVVTPDGKLYKIYRGNEWKPEEVLRDLKDAAAKG
ncbi:MAG TPA: SCO family protein [Pyrinomonadaceae bacterium]|nr:SCO family protein [Pyrinomonadaceae bacterium]